MEEIDIQEIAYYLFKKKIYIILATILGIILGIIYTKFLLAPMYSSNSTVILSKPTTTDTIEKKNENDAITQNDITLNSKLVATYSEILQSRSVALDVIDKLNLNINEDKLRKNISVTSKNDTEMLQIRVNNEDPNVAADIANTLASVFSQKVKEIYNIENVTVIDEAYATTEPYNVSYTKNAALFGIVGLVLSVGVLFIFFYFDTKIRSKQEVEDLLDVEVLAVIPEITR